MDAKVEFQNPDDPLARSAPSPILKFERPDWALSRTVEGLSQKAGVPPTLDEAGKASVGKLPDGAMKPAEFIAWLNRKLAGYEKLIPPDDIIEAELDARIAAKVRKSLTERILREANAEAQIAAAIADIEKPGATALTTGIKKLFKKKPASAWRDHIETVATELTGAAASEDAQ